MRPVSKRASAEYRRLCGIDPSQAAGLHSTAVRHNGALVTVYRSSEAGIEEDPETPWATVCEGHSTCVCHATLALAIDAAVLPEMWCEPCRDGEPEEAR